MKKQNKVICPICLGRCYVGGHNSMKKCKKCKGFGRVTSDKITVRVVCNLETSFDSTGDPKHDARFKKQIIRWIKSVVDNEIGVIPYVENAIEYLTHKTKFEIKHNN